MKTNQYENVKRSGRVAFTMGFKRSQNPHQAGTAEHRVWDGEWMKAEGVLDLTPQGKRLLRNMAFGHAVMEAMLVLLILLLLPLYWVAGPGEQLGLAIVHIVFLGSLPALRWIHKGERDDYRKRCLRYAKLGY
jgi:hypothetical protein